MLLHGTSLTHSIWRPTSRWNCVRKSHGAKCTGELAIDTVGEWYGRDTVVAIDNQSIISPIGSSTRPHVKDVAARKHVSVNTAMNQDE